MQTLNPRTGMMESARLAATGMAGGLTVHRAGATLAVLAMLLGLSACATGYHGLPPGLPIPGTPGIVALTNNPSAPFAVAGRTFSYGVTFNGGTAPFSCTSGSLPAGFMISSTATLLPSVGDEYCVVSANLPTTATTGTFQVTVTLTDSSSPPQTSNSTFTLTVNPALTAGAFTLANGVNGRAFTQNVSVSVAGGSHAAPYSCVVGGLPTLGLSNTAPSATSSMCTFTINGPATAAGMGSVTVTVMDGQENQTFPDGSMSIVVPPGTSAPSGTANNLTVRTEYAFTGVPASFPDGVVGRPYGTAAGTSPQVLMTTVSGTVGNAPLAMCALTSGAGGNPFVEAVSGMTSCALTSSANLTTNGALTLMISATDTPIPDPNNAAVVVVPAKTQTVSVNLTVQNPLMTVKNLTPVPNAVIGRTYGAPAATSLIFTATGGIGNGPTLAISSGTPPNGITCTPSAPVMNTATTDTCSSGGANVPVGSTTQTFTVTASDVANAATPAGTNVSDPNRFLAVTLTVNPALTFTPTGLIPTGPPSSVLPDAVNGRSYAVAPQTLLTFMVNGGTGTGTTLAQTGTLPTGMTCSYAAPTLSCSAATITQAGGTATTFMVMATDTANASVPAGNVTTDTLGDTSYKITTDAALSIATGLSTPMAPWTQNAAQPYLNATPSLTVTSMGGLPAAQTTYSCTSTGFAALGLTVGPISSMTPPTCPLSGTPTTAGTAVAVSITIHDTGNTAVPAGLTTASSTITINAQAMLTTTITSPADDGVSSTDTGGFVANRAYSLAVSAGTAGAPGTGNLTLSSTNLNAGNCAGLTLTTAPATTTVTGTIMGNPSATTTAPATNSCMFSLTVTDTTGTANTTNYTITIHAPLRLSFSPAAGFGNGAAGHAFSQALTASGGINPVQSCMGSGFPASLTPSFASGTPTCTIQGTPTVGQIGSYTGMVTVMDGTNTATAAAGTASASSMFMINAALAVVPPARIINGMNGFAYPAATTPVASVTYSATGGTGAAVTFFANATASGATCTAGAPANFPTGLSFMTLTATTTKLTGTPTLPGSASTLYSFPVCATDGGTTSTAAYAVQTGANVMLAVFEPTSYSSSTTAAAIEVVDTRTKAAGTAITLTGVATPSPSGLAISSDGLTLYVADVANNTIIPVNTITKAQGTAAALPVGCGAPVELAATPDPTQNGANRLFATCPGVPEVAAYNISSPATFTGGTIADISAPGLTYGVAIQSDNSHVFVTINDMDSLFAIDNTGTPATISNFALDATTDQPTGIALAPNGASVYAYIGKIGMDGGNQQGVEVVDVTAAGTSGTPGTVTTVVDNLLTATTFFNPDDVAVDPTNSFVYVTFPGTAQFGALDNTSATPTLIAGSPFNLPDPTGAAADSAGGVTVPPVPSGNVFAYFTSQNSTQVDVIQQGATPTATTQIGSTTAGRIKHIPIPQ